MQNTIIINNPLKYDQNKLKKLLDFHYNGYDKPEASINIEEANIIILLHDYKEINTYDLTYFNVLRPRR